MLLEPTGKTKDCSIMRWDFKKFEPRIVMKLIKYEYVFNLCDGFGDRITYLTDNEIKQL